jgi:hypothetical protein
VNKIFILIGLSILLYMHSKDRLVLKGGGTGYVHDLGWSFMGWWGI